jgi:pimeloyl-ACP methyl ester carboxylesterase
MLRLLEASVPWCDRDRIACALRVQISGHGDRRTDQRVYVCDHRRGWTWWSRGGDPHLAPQWLVGVGDRPGRGDRAYRRRGPAAKRGALRALGHCVGRGPQLLEHVGGQWFSRSLCSLLPRPFGCEVSQHFDRATFPVAATSNARCGFPAFTLTCLLRAKVYGGAGRAMRNIAGLPSIGVPTITLEGDANGAPHLEPSDFSGKYAHRTIKGGIGHNLPQEAPAAFAQAVIDVDVYAS